MVHRLNERTISSVVSADVFAQQDHICTIPQNKEHILKALKSKIEAIEAHTPATIQNNESKHLTLPDRKAWTFGDHHFDQHLPSGGLPSVGLHDILVAGPQGQNATTGFCLSLLARWQKSQNRECAFLWCQNVEAMREYGRPYGRGLMSFGINPANMILVAARRDKDVLWAVEEALRTPGLDAVIAEVMNVSFSASKRLIIAAREGQGTCLLVRPNNSSSSAANISWRISPLLSSPHKWDPKSPGAPRWQVELNRIRGSKAQGFLPKKWNMEWDNETNRFCMVTPMADQLSQSVTAAKKNSPPSANNILPIKRTG